jgi:preprotein translocase subunit SecA
MAKEAYNEGVEKLKEIANAVLQKTMDSLGDPVLSDKQKQQEKELEKFAAETMQNAMKQGEKTCEARNIEGEAKHKYMEKVQDAAQALIDKKREDQAKELVRTIEVEEQHRARW